MYPQFCVRLHGQWPIEAIFYLVVWKVRYFTVVMFTKFCKYTKITELYTLCTHAGWVSSIYNICQKFLFKKEHFGDWVLLHPTWKEREIGPKVKMIPKCLVHTFTWQHITIQTSMFPIYLYYCRDLRGHVFGLVLPIKSWESAELTYEMEINVLRINKHGMHQCSMSILVIHN